MRKSQGMKHRKFLDPDSSAGVPGRRYGTGQEAATADRFAGDDGSNRGYTPDEIEGHLKQGRQIIEGDSDDLVEQEAAASIEDSLQSERLVEANRVSPEPSERNERLLEWLLGPRRESLPNTLFEPSELKEINVSLEELKKYLTTMLEMQKFRDEQLDAMETTLDAMREASKRIGRKDWLLLGIGAVTALAISAAFPPATVVHFTKLFVHKVGYLFAKELAG
jgi:hypothetical protein